jgi:two-component system, OmpR family, sensor kinase
VRVSRRWRPSLAFVLGGALAGTLAQSFAALVALRYLGPAIGFRNAAILLALTITAATALLGWLLVRLLLRPILALEHYADAQEQATRPSPPKHFGTRELYATASRVIAMAETLRDREATIRAYTDHVTHELKTPVSAIRVAVELLEDEPGLSDGDRHLISKINEARQQIEAQLAALRRAAQARETRYLGQTNLAEVMPVLARDWPDLALSASGERLGLPLAAEGLVVVLRQLIRNAVESGAGRVLLHAHGDAISPMIDITDDGRGVSEGNAARIFEPFFTTRRDSGGTGIGLTVVSNILQAHRGDIALIPSPRGTSFRIAFRDGSF